MDAQIKCSCCHPIHVDTKRCIPTSSWPPSSSKSSSTPSVISPPSASCPPSAGSSVEWSAFSDTHSSWISSILSSNCFFWASRGEKADDYYLGLLMSHLEKSWVRQGTLKKNVLLRACKRWGYFQWIHWITCIHLCMFTCMQIYLKMKLAKIRVLRY